MRNRASLLILACAIASATPAGAQVTSDIPGLIVNLEKADPATKAASARLLGELGAAAKDAVPALTAVLKDESKDVRREAAKALGKIGPAAAEAVPALSASLDDSNWELRRNAVTSMGQIGDPKAEPALKKAKNDPNDKVRAAAKRALKQLKKAKK